MLDQEIFIDRRSDLRHKKSVFRIVGRLCVVGVPGVHGMSHLMGDRGDTVQRPREIGHDIGVGVVGARTEGAAALSAVGVDIDPAGAEPLPDNITVTLSQRGNRIQDHLLCLLVGVLPAAASREGGVEVIVMEFVQRQDLFAKLRILVHGRKVGPHRLDQCVIHFHRDILLRHGHGARGCISAHLSLCRGSFDRAGIGRRECIDMLPVSFIETEKSVFAKCPVGTCLEKDIIRTRQLMLLPLCVFYRIKNHVRILQIIGDQSRRGEHLAETGEQGLFLFGKCVGLLPQELFHRKTIGREVLFFHGSPQRLFRERKDLRLDECRARHSLYKFGIDPGVHDLCLRGACVLAPAQVCIGKKIAQEKIELRLRLHKGTDALCGSSAVSICLRYFAVKRRDGIHFLSKLPESSLPGFIILI